MLRIIGNLVVNAWLSLKSTCFIHVTKGYGHSNSHIYLVCEREPINPNDKRICYCCCVAKRRLTCKVPCPPPG